ncbi:hypothetical protein GIB67_033747 [Kingdonia uniflora]|uniref:Sulfotransferase n=1 Tax=Kingdonia uniflora TaxID=39325 RepID=A0A7J7P450_9MAGN|nr:hypothetical protein GIB67_033747 [Kingdonia uniflora]
MAQAQPFSYEKCFVHKSREEREEDERTYNMYKTLVQTLPTKKGLGCGDLYDYQGFWYEYEHCAPIMAVQDHFKPRSTDILLVTAPKSGTTWMKALMFAIMNRNSYSSDEHPLLTFNPHMCVPFLEGNIYKENVIPDLNVLPSPRLFATHIPYSSQPKLVKESRCRIVYLCRNPRDTFVLFWDFINQIRAKNLIPALELEDAVEMFCDGITPFGPLWDHILGYWKESIDSPENVLFLKYEELQAQPLVHLKRVAEFVGCPFSPDEEKGEALTEITNLCSLDNLRNSAANQTGMVDTAVVSVEASVFFRQCEIGDSEKLLTTDMTEKIDLITKTKLCGSGLTM